MQHYISIYEGGMSHTLCETLIDMFEANPACHQPMQSHHDDWQMRFTQIIMREQEQFSAPCQQLETIILDAIAMYKTEHGIVEHQWPQHFCLEPLRMKRYLPKTQTQRAERFDAHVDVTNYETARRFLVAFIYLNDDFIGGETDFVQLGYKVKPKQGSILSSLMWNWLHKAHPVVSGRAKYTVGTLLHYV